MTRILCNVAGGGKPLKGNAEAGDVLAGKTFSNKQSNALTGSMPNNGAWSASTSGNGSVTIPAGYHNGSGTVSGATSYSNGYSKGVSAADARVNTSSASYKSGYAKGKSDGEAAAVSGIQVYYTAKKGAVPWGGWQGGQKYYISKNTAIGSQVAYINDESGEYGIRVKIDRIS